MNLLEKKSRSTYDQYKDYAPFSEDELNIFIDYLNTTATESIFLNPLEFSDDYGLEYDTCLSILLFFADNEDSLLLIRPVIECLNNTCKDILFVNPNEQFIYCKECDEFFDTKLYVRYLKFLFEINPKLYNLFKMSLCTNSYEKVKSVSTGLKHFPPSNTYNISPKELEGGVGFNKLSRINNASLQPISSSFNDIQKSISKSMV